MHGLKRTAFVMLLSGALPAAPVSAAAILVTDRAAFLATVDVQQTVDFNSLAAPGYLGNPGSIDTGLANVNSNTPIFVQSSPVRATYGSYLTAQTAGPTNVAISFDNPVTAFGFDYSSQFAVNLTIAGQSLIATPAVFPSFGFAGILSDTPFSSLVISPTADTSGASGIDLDNFVAGLYDPADVTPAVPEPTTWAMMIVGFGAVGGAMRYRRRETKVTFA